MNTCLNLVKVNLAPGVRKPVPKLDSTNNLDFATKLGITTFLDFALTTLLLPLTLSIVVLLPINIRSLIKDFILLIFNIEISEMAIWLKLEMKCK